MSLSDDGSVLAVGGLSDTFGFKSSLESDSGYDLLFVGFGAVWIFVYNGSDFEQDGHKLVGTGEEGQFSLQGQSIRFQKQIC